VTREVFVKEEDLFSALHEALPNTGRPEREPNTALLSAILMFGTFFIAYFLRIFRNSQYFGRTVSSFFSSFVVRSRMFI
jgi:hypothetical protein